MTSVPGHLVFFSPLWSIKYSTYIRCYLSANHYCDITTLRWQIHGNKWCLRVVWDSSMCYWVFYKNRNINHSMIKSSCQRTKTGTETKAFENPARERWSSEGENSPHGGGRVELVMLKLTVLENQSQSARWEPQWEREGEGLCNCQQQRGCRLQDSFCIAQP